VRDQQLAATPTNHRHLALPDRLGQINRREGCPGGDGLACTVFHGDADELAEEMQRPPAAGAGGGRSHGVGDDRRQGVHIGSGVGRRRAV